MKGKVPQIPLDSIEVTFSNAVSPSRAAITLDPSIGGMGIILIIAKEMFSSTIKVHNPCAIGAIFAKCNGIEKAKAKNRLVIIPAIDTQNIPQRQLLKR